MIWDTKTGGTATKKVEFSFDELPSAEITVSSDTVEELPVAAITSISLKDCCYVFIRC